MMVLRFQLSIPDSHAEQLFATGFTSVELRLIALLADKLNQLAGHFSKAWSGAKAVKPPG
jgi:hypothetical protein